MGKLKAFYNKIKADVKHSRDNEAFVGYFYSHDKQQIHQRLQNGVVRKNVCPYWTTLNHCMKVNREVDLPDTKKSIVIFRIALRPQMV
jgi:hypothetical protein